MKNKIKRLFIILLLFIIVISSTLLYLFQKRQYFWLSDNQCITLWKTAEGAYLIPGKYTSWFKPKDNFNYIKTSNMQFLTIYYSNAPDTLIVRDQGEEGGREGKIEIKNNIHKSPIFENFSNDCKKYLYNSRSKNFKDVKDGVSYLDINVFEGYALTNDGRVLN